VTRSRVATFTRWTGWAVSSVLAFGLLTLWVRQRWAVAACQIAILALSVLWALLAAWLRAPIRLHPAFLPFAAVPAIGALQLAFHQTVLPWYTSEKTIEWTVHLLAAFLLYQAAGSARFRAHWLDALFLFSTLIAIVSLLQVFTSDGRVFWLFESGYKDDVLGPFVYRNKYAQFVELVIPAGLFLALRTRHRAPFALVAVAIMAAGIVAGASRSGLALLLLEVLAVVLAAWYQQWLSGRMALLWGGQIALLILVWGFIAGWDYLWGRLVGLDPLADLRFPLMATTLDMIRARPLQGFGLGTWPLVYPEFARFDIGLVANQAHCDWLQWAAEGGLPQLAALLALTALLFRSLVRSLWGIGFLAVLVHATLDYPFMQLPLFATLIFACAFVAAAESTSDAH